MDASQRLGSLRFCRVGGHETNTQIEIFRVKLPLTNRSVYQMPLNIFSLLHVLFLCVWASVFLVILIKMVRSAPPRNVSRKYSRSISLQSLIPFLKSWKNRVDPEDVSILERNGKAVFLLILALVVFEVTFEVLVYFDVAYFKGD